MTENKVEVIIGGNIYSLKGDESQEHIQKVAALIDKKILELQKSNINNSLNTSKLYMLAAINVADEYIKLKKKYEAYEQELIQCNMENLALKQRLDEITLELAQAKVQAVDKTVTKAAIEPSKKEDTNKDDISKIETNKVDTNNDETNRNDTNKEDGDSKKYSANSIKNNIKKNNESSNRGR